VRAAGAEERLVPIGEGAGGRDARRDRHEAIFLGRTGFAAADVLAFAVQHNDVPRSEFVAVVARLRVTGSRSEIVEVGCPASGNGTRDCPPRGWCGFLRGPSLVITGEIVPCCRPG